MQSMQNLAAVLRLGGATIYPLLVLAFVAAVVVIEKAFVLATRARLPRSLRALIATDAFTWEQVEHQVEAWDRAITSAGSSG